MQQDEQEIVERVEAKQRDWIKTLLPVVIMLLIHGIYFSGAFKELQKDTEYSKSDRSSLHDVDKILFERLGRLESRMDVLCTKVDMHMQVDNGRSK